MAKGRMVSAWQMWFAWSDQGTGTVGRGKEVRKAQVCRGVCRGWSCRRWVVACSQGVSVQTDLRIGLSCAVALTSNIHHSHL